MAILFSPRVLAALLAALHLPSASRGFVAPHRRAARASPGVRGQLAAASNDYDVIIVGAGIAGLEACRTILAKKAAVPDRILLLEGRNRIGGRILKKTHALDRTPNNPVDVGACWVCPEQPLVYQMVQDLGLTLVPQEDRGLRVRLPAPGGGEARCGLDELPEADVEAYVGLGQKFEKMADELIEDSEQPWLAPDAEKWDAMTCEEYLVKEVPNEAARGLMRSALLAVFCLPTTEFSMLWFLANLKAEGSFDMFTVGAQSHRVLEGNGSIIPILGKEVADAGVKTVLGATVTACDQVDMGKGVTLTTKDGTAYKASQVVMTLPPTERRKVAFEPALPQAEYDDEMRMGQAIKTVLAYEKRWWDGTFAFADPALDGCKISLVADVSHADGKEAVLATFFYGDSAAEFSGDDMVEARRAASIEGAQALLCPPGTDPDPVSNRPISVVEGDWPSVPGIGGGYANVPRPGAIVKTKMFHRDLQKAFGNLHFAGTEHAERWAGYIEGAIMTGRKAGDEVAEALLAKE